MSKIPNRDNAIVRCKMHYDRTILFANYWLAMATTGAAKNRSIKRGREPTEEERARGEIVGWNERTDDEKILDALNTATTHIQNLEKITETIIALENDDFKAYQESLLR
jgi:hypothetical protein